MDTKVFLSDGHIQTDLFCKPTDSHSYQRFNSAHPKGCKERIPYCQFLHIHRICSRVSDFDKHIVTFSKHFLNRGYPIHLIETAALKVRRLDMDTLLQPTPKVDTIDTKVLPLVTTFHPTDNSLVDTVKYNLGYPR